MPTPKKNAQISNRIAFLDYEPAEVKELKNNNWRIVFRCRIPGSNTMKRFRRRVKPMSNKKERMRYAKKICAAINQKLAEGWSPFTDDTANKEYRSLQEAINRYEKECNTMVDRGQMRPDTARSYSSQLSQLSKYLEHIGEPNLFAASFNRAFMRKYLDHIYYDKGRTPRTVNNYLRFGSQFANWLVEREYLVTNSISGIPQMVNQKKKREIIDPHTRKQIIKELKRNNTGFLVCCLMVYYCMIRRTELTKLRVGDVKLLEGVIVVPSEVSKNKKNDTVTIPQAFISYLVDHLKGATNQDFLFSENFKPGGKGLSPKKVSDTWAALRKKIGFKKEYQFYSLKDTGITQLFYLNVPLIKIRDQARHHDIKITESYTPRNYKKDKTLFKLENEF
ncbi:tyrosine-type recombinase/integrase [Leeuwenhoekiella polynyae]|uniref:Site-specific recombinase XerD n=1 Tax=Leeuwenhoekiella polynyae TaxID=1550906 RepID=A0A4Q0PFN6_9FLAO|nr:site-specific integrase [Leeuwenhoekiella polynyae]RXG25715.1 site-specific recombinase XerD [Leeuwenhoekiella polynyae]